LIIVGLLKVGSVRELIVRRCGTLCKDYLPCIGQCASAPLHEHRAPEAMTM
jgi:hypothetical protein